MEQHISPRYPATSPLFSSLCPPPFCTAVQRETGRQNAKGGHVPLINTEHLLGFEKTSFQYWPDICYMCLLRGPNGHIRAIYPVSRQSVSRWRPKLPSSSLGAHCPPLEAWYLGCIRIAPHAGVYPLTCEGAEGEGVRCVMCCCYCGRECGHCGCCRAHHRLSQLNSTHRIHRLGHW
jgi:hypothetical protein